jgi:RHS repeat-associated protein
VAYDGNGNVMGLVDAADGGVVAEYDYDPWGGKTPSSEGTQLENPYGFSTKYTDSPIGLLYYGLRSFHPASQTWINRDSLQEAGGLNMYSFLFNRPVDDVDVLGRSALRGLFGELINPDFIPPSHQYGSNASCTKGDIRNLSFNMTTLVGVTMYTVKNPSATIREFLASKAEDNGKNFAASKSRLYKALKSAASTGKTFASNIWLVANVTTGAGCVVREVELNVEYECCAQSPSGRTTWITRSAREFSDFEWTVIWTDSRGMVDLVDEYMRVATAVATQIAEECPTCLPNYNSDPLFDPQLY